MLAAIDWANLLELIWVAPVAGISVAVAYGVTILSVSRAADARRDGAGALSTAWALLAAVSLLLFLGGVGFAIALITTK